MLRIGAGLSGTVPFVFITHMFSEMHPLGNIYHDASIGTVSTNAMTPISDQGGGSRAYFNLRLSVQARVPSAPASVCTVMEVVGQIIVEYRHNVDEKEKTNYKHESYQKGTTCGKAYG